MMRERAIPETTVKAAVPMGLFGIGLMAGMAGGLVLLLLIA